LPEKNSKIKTLIKGKGFSMNKNKIYISWEGIFSRLKQFDYATNVVYGIPSGGMILTAFLKNAKVTHDPKEATMILDDVIDSGKTAQKYLQYGVPVRALFTSENKIDYELMKKNWIVFPWEMDHPAGQKSVQDNIVRMLQYLGEDPTREGLLETPNRIVKSWSKLYEGYTKDPKDIFTCFDSAGYDQIILSKDIEIYSTCEHHMLPFFGKAHVAYIPNERIVGISKLSRLVDIFARRMQIQERIGQQVTDALMEHLKPKAAACIIEAKHMCMCMRGVEKQNSTMVTSSMTGVFLTKPEAKQELMQLLK
jgi:GTP cyclohydrolase I